MKDAPQIYKIDIKEDKKESTKHGTYYYPIAIYKNDIKKNVLGIIDWHWHDEMQLALVQEGRVEFNIQSEKIVLKKGEALFVNGDVLHMARPYGSDDGIYLCIDFAPRILSGFEGNIIERKYIAPYYKNKNFPCFVFKNDSDVEKEIISLIHSIVRVNSERNDAYEIATAACLLSIWQLLIEHKFFVSDLPISKANYNYERIVKVLEYINNNFHSNISLEELAKKVNISASELCRVFKNLTDSSISDYIYRCRINESLNLLENTNLSMTEIANHVGYGDSSYFSMKFKNFLHQTPSEFRKSIKKK